jgi:hypothetical protein
MDYQDFNSHLLSTEAEHDGYRTLRIDLGPYDLGEPSSTPVPTPLTLPGAVVFASQALTGAALMVAGAFANNPSGTVCVVFGVVILLFTRVR